MSHFSSSFGNEHFEAELAQDIELEHTSASGLPTGMIMSSAFTQYVDPEVGRFPSPQGNTQSQITGDFPPGREMENFQSLIWDTKQCHRMLKLLQFVT